MDITFCPYCRKQVPLTKSHDCPDKPEESEGTPEAKTVTVTLNRKQRRQAMARAKIRMRKEKK